jgi:ribosomal protein L40E
VLTQKFVCIKCNAKKAITQQTYINRHSL